MPTLHDFVPQADALLALEPDELGFHIIRAVVDWPRAYSLTLGQFLELQVCGRQGLPTHAAYQGHQLYEVREAVREAWAWLEGQGLLIPPPEARAGSDFRSLSRRARRIAEQPDPRRGVPGRTIPKPALHPAIREDVWALYHRGKYDTAVFEAMKAVEVAVRAAAGFTDADYGVDMVARAFNDEKGPLRNLAAPQAERVAERNLFTGALGLYKNPH